MKKIKLFKDFIRFNLWDINLANLPWYKKIIYSLLRMLHIAYSGLKKDSCDMYAYALSFITLISIVPLAAVSFSVSKGFGAQKALENFIFSKIQNFPDGFIKGLYKILNYVENTNFKTLGIIGIFILFYTVISGLGKIEKAFNHIWEIRTQRKFIRKIADYLSVLIIVPFFLIAAASINATMLSNTFRIFILSQFKGISFFIFLLLKIAPYISIWISFTFIFWFLPNTNVRFFSALTGGIISGTLWQIILNLILKLQIGLAKYNAIYGSFAIFFLILMFIYLNWLILLFGTEISFATQNFIYLKPKKISAGSFIYETELVLLKILKSMRDGFIQGEAFNPKIFSIKEDIPYNFILSFLNKLTDKKIIYQISNNQYTLALPADKIFLKDLLRIFITDTGNNNNLLDETRALVLKINKNKIQAVENLRLSDI